MTADQNDGKPVAQPRCPLVCGPGGTLAHWLSRFFTWWPPRLLALLMLSGGGCATRLALTRYEFTQPQMGLPFRIVLYAPDAATAQAAAQAAFARIAELNSVLSDYDSDSELSRLSQTSGEGKDVPLSKDLWFVLNRAQTLARETDGSFDVTVGPFVNLWRKARRQRELPNPTQLAEARAAVGFRKLQLDPRRRSARLLAPKMRLDLGAIAKGYAIDQALSVLRTNGLHRALVAGGGDIAAGEPPPGQSGWRIELAPLDTTNAPPARFIRLTSAALATSGDAFQRLEIDGVRYSHVIDPHTGMGLTDHSLVTIIADDCIEADSLATAVSILGPKKGLKFIRTRGAEARIVRQPEEVVFIHESVGFQNYCESEPIRPRPRS